MPNFVVSIRKRDTNGNVATQFFKTSTIMTNQQVINAFVNKKSGHSSNGNLFSTGDKLINYQTCIAQRMQNGTIIINTTKYSVSTSKIQSALQHNIKIYKEITNVPVGSYGLTKFVI